MFSASSLVRSITLFDYKVSVFCSAVALKFRVYHNSGRGAQGQEKIIISGNLGDSGAGGRDPTQEALSRIPNSLLVTDLADFRLPSSFQGTSSVLCCQIWDAFSPGSGTTHAFTYSCTLLLLLLWESSLASW